MERRHVMGHDARHHLDQPPEVVWAGIESFDRFEGWWTWLSGLSVRGTGLAAGSVLEGWVTPPLPYRIHVIVTVTESVPGRRVDAEVSGDLRGPACLELEPDPSGGTLAHTSWSLEMMQWPMRVASRVAGPMLRWGHDRVVEMTLAGFERQLRSVGPPPAPPPAG